MRDPGKAGVLACIFLLTLAAQIPDHRIEEAVNAFQHGELALAEATLETVLRERPKDPDALAFMAVVLDNEKKFSQAETFYRQALALSPRSPSLLNNYGNHLLASGHSAGARSTFLRVLALDPAQSNAAVQLARIALENESPGEALRYFEHWTGNLPPDVAILKMQAEYLSGRTKDADIELGRLATLAGADPHLNFNLGMALASARQYDKAEGFFSRALAGDPRNFDILYNLGLTASHAGHNERALEVLQTALEQQPRNVDVLYDLAAVNRALNHQEAALDLLVKASQIAPDRADVQRLLARTTADLGYFGDSVQAWDRYVQLTPGDDEARRERAVAESILGADQKSLADLHWYLGKHPDDPIGHYDLGIVESRAHPAEALAQFNRAIALKRDFTPAYVARASLRYAGGEPAAALPDLEFAARHDPQNPVVFDKLGQAYAALDRNGDAMVAWKRAADLAPRNSTILLHYAHALLKAGQAEEAQRMMARVRDVGPDRPTVLPRPAGIVEFLSLTPQEQYAQYRAGVERTVQNNPQNADAQVEYLKLSLRENKLDRVSGISRRIIKLNPPVTLLKQAARALLEAGQYTAAKTFCESALLKSASDPDLVLDLAVALFHLGDVQSALEQMSGIAEAHRTGDYYLARAVMLLSAGQRTEGDAALQQALTAAPARSDLYREAAGLLIQSDRRPEALKFLKRGAQALPDDPEILLSEAIALELNSQSGAAEQVLKQIESRWPEWYKVWLAHGIVERERNHPDQARQMMDTASALGAPQEALHDSLLQLLLAP